MTQVFKSKAIAVGSPTVGQNILSSMSGWMSFLTELKFKKKKAAAFGCYGWSGESPKLLADQLKDAGFDVVEPVARVNWNPTEEDLAQMMDVAKALAE